MIPRAVLAVLEYILIPKYINFYGKYPVFIPVVGWSKDRQSVETAFFGKQVRVADFKHGIKLFRAHSGCLGANRR